MWDGGINGDPEHHVSIISRNMADVASWAQGSDRRNQDPEGSEVNEFAVWEQCWNRLDGVFRQSAEVFREANPALWFQTGWRSTAKFPFDAWLELKRVEDPARIEDIVVFVSFSWEAGRYRGEVDIATGEGAVLADGPAAELAVDPAEWPLQMERYGAEVLLLLEDHRLMLRDALC
ncbi:hypothetical protein ACSHWB_08280 [Lentzea sp. HUAS TT2]|uniref:hypothetical protein n=1 Tax=Lentzea sp. HUAS TT2 TaxID=3447454 RepID=UPI003F6FFEB0